jgi:hypothetical protein
MYISHLLRVKQTKGIPICDLNCTRKDKWMSIRGESQTKHAISGKDGTLLNMMELGNQDQHGQKVSSWCIDSK